MEDIQKNALNLFSKYGLNSVNMDDLAFHLKISKKKLYQLYGSKEDLIYKILESTTEEWEDNLTKINSSNQNPIAKLIDIILLRYEYIIKLNPAFLIQSGKQYVQILKLFTKGRKELNEISMRFLVMAKNQKLLFGGVDIKRFIKAHDLLFEYFINNNNLKNPESFETFKYLLFPPLIGITNQNKISVLELLKEKQIASGTFL